MIDPKELAVVEKPLSQREEKRLDELEAVIDKNIKAFFAVWFALKEIHDGRLYRNEDNRTFERYCEEEWDISRRRGYQFIDAAEVVQNVNNCLHSDETEMCTIVHIEDLESTDGKYPPFPINEGQARRLKDVAPEHQKEVWDRVCKNAEDMECKITAKLVGQCVKEFKLEKFGEVVNEITHSVNTPYEPKTDVPKISLPLRTSLANTLEVLQHESGRGWRGSNQDVVITWLRTLLSAAEEAR